MIVLATIKSAQTNPLKKIDVTNKHANILK